MVYIIDEGSVFDAPIDKIWKYLQSDEHDHPSVKTLSREMKGNTVEITREVTVDGKPVQSKTKITMYPPFGMVQEHLEGPIAGSRAFQFYIPKGDKTGVTLVGDFISAGKDDNAVKQMMMQLLQTTFDEDNTNLKKMQ
jgi:hypothetical protein